MTTTITINSLQRFDNDIQTASDPNPFNFHLSPKTTSNWVWKRRPFSQTGLTKNKDAFTVKVCRVFIPKAFVPVQPSQLFLQITSGTSLSIDKQIGPKIKHENIFGGFTGACEPFPDIVNYHDTWSLYPTHGCGVPLHWIYESCSEVDLNHDWKALQLHVIIRDSEGYILEPPFPPANGLTGFTGSLCDYNVSTVCCGPTGCRPNACCPDYINEYRNCKSVKVVPLPPAEFDPFFQKDNQVIIILKSTYNEFDGIGSEECFK